MDLPYFKCALFPLIIAWPASMCLGRRGWVSSADATSHACPPLSKMQALGPVMCSMQMYHPLQSSRGHVLDRLCISEWKH